MRRRDENLQARLLCGAAAAALLFGTAPAMAQEAPTKFNIAAQPLADGLNEFARQSGRPVMFTPEVTGARMTRGVSDVSDPELALNLVLAETGLTWRRSGDTYLITRAAADPQSGSAAGDGAGTVDTLVVTAQKREEDIQDVPIAISAFSQEDLTRSQVAGGPDLMTQVPNMTFTKTNFSSYSIQLRGIGTQAISATVDPAVAVAFNNTPFIRNRFFEQEFYDLQRVEVLRGPQGTLYGRNATAGVVNIISQKPKFAYEAKLSGDVANYNTTRLEGMVNLPLVEDVVALRLAGAWTKRDGYATNEITGAPIDGRDLWSTRVSLRVTPTDAIDANLIWEHFEEDDDRIRSGKQLCHKDIVTEVGGISVDTYDGTAPGALNLQSQHSQGCKPASLYAPESFETPNGLKLGYYGPLSAIGLPIAPGAKDPYLRGVQSRDLRVIESTVDPSYKAKSDIVELQVNLDLSDTLTLSSETAWSSEVLFSTQDYNRFNTKPGAWAQTSERPGLLVDGVFCDPQIGCADRLVSVDLIDSKATQFSQELRLASDFDGPFNFSLGGNFLRADSEDKYYVFINALTLWGATSFQTSLDTPYVLNGENPNAACRQYGLDLVDLDNAGLPPVTGGRGCLYIDPNPIGSLDDLGHNYFLSKNPYKLISYAMFGEAYYELADNLKVTAGLRWTVDRKEAPRIPSWLIAQGVGYPVLEVIEQEWREPTGRLTIDWKPDLAFTDETLLYASYAHGYKAGGANPPPAGVALNVNIGEGVPTPSDTHPTTFEAEFMDAFELGAKNTLFDGRVTANLAAFYYDYKGYQLSQIVDRSAITKNFDAQIWGLELEADWRPLENFRLGLKLGYEDTKVADGMSAVDIMDRSNGNQLDYIRDGNGDFLLDGNGEPIPFHWIVVSPFPAYPSNCIVPDYLVVYDRGEGGGVQINQLGNGGGSSNGPCNMAYIYGWDPLVSAPYTDPPPPGPFYSNGGAGALYPNYPGFNPATAPNNGEGISKDLSGNELPNAPHYTATITADYTVPLPNDWLATLHTDLYYQSEAWTRIFNTEGYDKLKAYTNVNLAAIFTNEEAGWNVMAYVKNVFDRDSITGAFLNSDDSGLTTNVFLTEPRLYGLRVTKNFTGGPWWTGANPNHTGPYPLTVELSGQVQRQDAPYDPMRPTTFEDEIPASIDVFNQGQNTDLDWGDGREARITWRPDGGPWSVSAGVRYGRTNGAGPRLRGVDPTPEVCALPDPYGYLCPYLVEYFGGDRSVAYASRDNWADVYAVNREEHNIVDFSVGRDVGMGTLSRSSLSAGLTYAQFSSDTSARLDSLPDWDIPEAFKYADVAHSRHTANFRAKRDFEGAGPRVNWNAAQRLWGAEDSGHVDVEWSVGGGALFGKQETSVVGSESSAYYEFSGVALLINSDIVPPIAPPEITPVEFRRETSVTVPVVDLSLGLSYEIQRIKIGAGYRWERYFDVLDVGFDEAKDADRTIDGPYFKLSVGFGGG